MQTKHLSERYNRQIQLPGFGTDAQEKLREAKVLVVGAGGLGVPALQYLAGMGIGTLGIVDGDRISLSNLHRQVLYSTEDIGKPKVLIAAARLAALNPEVRIRSFHTNLYPHNALEIISDFNVVIDATDNFSARYLINDGCVILHKPFVHGAVHQFEGHISVFNLESDSPTYRCLYPTPPSATEIPDCNTAGVLGVIPGIIGCRQALEVVKLITGIGKSISGYLQVFDFLNDEQYKMKLKANPANKKIQALQPDYETLSCSIDIQSLSPQMLNEWYHNNKRFEVIDVREQDEYKSASLPYAKNIPLSKLGEAPFSKDPAIPIVVYCQKGNRSARAVLTLRERQPSLEIYDLTGGIDNWVKHEANL